MGGTGLSSASAAALAANPDAGPARTEPAAALPAATATAAAAAVAAVAASAGTCNILVAGYGQPGGPALLPTAGARTMAAAPPSAAAVSAAAFAAATAPAAAAVGMGVPTTQQLRHFDLTELIGDTSAGISVSQAQVCVVLLAAGCVNGEKKNKCWLKKRQIILFELLGDTSAGISAGQAQVRGYIRWLPRVVSGGYLGWLQVVSGGYSGVYRWLPGVEAAGGCSNQTKKVESVGRGISGRGSCGLRRPLHRVKLIGYKSAGSSVGWQKECISTECRRDLRTSPRMLFSV